MVHGNSLCQECINDDECGGTTREGCEIIKIDYLEKLIKVGIYISKKLNSSKTYY